MKESTNCVLQKAYSWKQSLNKEGKVFMYYMHTLYLHKYMLSVIHHKEDLNRKKRQPASEALDEDEYKHVA